VLVCTPRIEDRSAEEPAANGDKERSTDRHGMSGKSEFVSVQHVGRRGRSAVHSPAEAARRSCSMYVAIRSGVEVERATEEGKETELKQQMK
jgi:hypothetical protein